ncbi:DUF6980 family protein [Taibaiella koreensis]|uniref:DUF6980 family protein n=1 Tax=Taibaiella koreensis TaxID=1268548 RepID=UPI000E599F8E|nr:hypothetical protein [Taibaiella koreensis]
MDLKTFKKLYKRFNQFPLSKQEWEAPEYEKYQEALHDDNDCGDWYLKQKIKEAGIHYKRFCCLSMAYRLVEDKLRNIEGNVDRIMTYNKGHKTFGIPIHDGGASYIKIAYCPWCGKDLSGYPVPVARCASGSV